MQKYLKGSLKLVDAGSRFLLFDSGHEITYNLFLKIKKGESYEGEVTVNFGLQKVSSNLFFDFSGSTLKEIIINGTSVPTTDGYESLREERYLRLPESHLKVGGNEVRVVFENSYANDGLGLHSFIDTDGKQYVYSQCEAYAANKIFPCFDQPDLKAKLSLTMAVPTDWVAISNQPVDSEVKTSPYDSRLTEDEKQSLKVVTFLPTLKLSTYLYAFIAGPYLEIKSTKIHRTITMSCYCRESLFQYMEKQAEEIFEITRECLIFFEKFFNFPYPFAKYDSIFCPEFKFGAMENAGAVTFNDLYIWRGNVTIDRNTIRAATITHEASHHWFGDLVTMKWWNDLWLNESFAVYISYYCLTQIGPKLTTTKFCDVWLKFFNRKCTGYNADAKKTTHSIAGEVRDTEEAETIFDSITYSKGASTLKQLVSLIGVENFSKAISEYFSRFAWTNATIEDFTACLQEFYTPSFPGCPKDLREWRGEWIQTAGLNECLPLFNPNDLSPNATLRIQQRPVLKQFPTLRHHKLIVAFFNEEGKVYDTKEILLTNTPETVIEYDGSKRPSAILLNYQDEAFIKAILDQHSLAFFKRKLVSIQDELTRALIWRSISDMVKDGLLSAYQFTLIAEESILNETSDSVLETIFTFVHMYLFYLSPKILTNNILKPKLFASTLKVLVATDKSRTNRITLLTDNLIEFASFGEEKNVDNISRLMSWFDGTDAELKNITLSTANKWAIVKKLHRYPRVSPSTQQSYYNKVAEIDKSDNARFSGVYCEAMRATLEERNKLWEGFLDANDTASIKIFQQRTTAYNQSLRNSEKHEETFFDALEKVFANRSVEFAAAFYSNMFPLGERIGYYKQRVKEISKTTKNQRLLKLTKSSLENLKMRRKAYICAAPDVLREFLQISI